jgi:hypothetical protein
MTAKEKPVVAYYYDEESGNYCYTVNHPWRPHRSKLVHNLVTGYNLEKEMIVHRPRARTFEEITEFHADGGAHERRHGRQNVALWLGLLLFRGWHGSERLAWARSLAPLSTTAWCCKS